MSPFHSDALNRLVTRKIDHDETILWSAEGCSATSLMLALYWLQLFPAMVFLGIIISTSLDQTYRELLSDLAASGPFLAFFLAAFLLLVGIPAFCILRANRFAYVVSTKRLLILNDFLIPMARSVAPDEMELVALLEKGDRGTISIRITQNYFELYATKQMEQLLMPRIIMNAPNAKAALKPLNALLQMKKERQAEEATKP